MFPWEEFLGTEQEEIEKEAGFNPGKAIDKMLLKRRVKNIGREAKRFKDEVASNFGDAYLNAMKDKRGVGLSGLSGKEQAKAVKEHMHGLASKSKRGKEITERSLKAQEDLRRLKAGKRSGRHTLYNAGIGAATLGTLGAAGYGAKKALDDGKEAVSGGELERIAIEMALEKVASAGWDVAEADERLAALYTLELDTDLEETKVAFATDIETALEYRSLELLENVGYPIDWS